MATVRGTIAKSCPFNSGVACHASEGGQILARGSRAHAARHRHSGKCGKGHTGSQGPQCGPREVFRSAADQQGRRDGCEGNRA